MPAPAPKFCGVECEPELLARDMKAKTCLLICPGDAMRGDLLIAKQLLKQGATVVLAGIDTSTRSVKQRSADFPGAVFMSVDLRDVQSIKTFVKYFYEQYEELYLLCNLDANAFAEEQKKSGVNQRAGARHGLMVSHFLGYFFVTHLLLPLLKASHGSRILNTSSMTASEEEYVTFRHSCHARQQSRRAKVVANRFARLQHHFRHHHHHPHEDHNHDQDDDDDHNDDDDDGDDDCAWLADPRCFRRTYNDCDAFGQSRILQLQHARDLTVALRGSTVTVISIHPAWEKAPSEAAAASSKKKKAMTSRLRRSMRWLARAAFGRSRANGGTLLTLEESSQVRIHY